MGHKRLSRGNFADAGMWPEVIMNTVTTHNASISCATATATAATAAASTESSCNVASPTGYAATTRFGVRHVAGIVLLTSLLACGSMPGERAVSGAGLGAGAGAALGAVTGMGVGTGAAIGAAAGAAAGGLTKEKDVNLGKPIWK